MPFYIFYNVSAGFNEDGIGDTAQQRSGPGSAVGDGDRFRASHGGEKFPFQNVHVGFVSDIRFFHILFPLFFLFSCALRLGGEAEGR